MGTTEKKKHKSGYELLKEKYAALEKERDELKEKLTDVINEKDSFADDCKRLYKERDEWKAKYEEQRSLFDKLYITSRDIKDRIDFLLDHCPFWVRWMLRKQFKKGGKE